ncbi:MAG: hypothetical protein ACYCQJ_12240 [Nitrososphaerales archaeon]
MLNYIYVGHKTENQNAELQGYILYENQIYFRRDYLESNAKVPQEDPPVIVFSCGPKKIIYWIPVQNPIAYGNTYFYDQDRKILYDTQRDSQLFRESRFTGDLSDRTRLYSFRKGRLLTSSRLKQVPVTNIFNAQSTPGILFYFALQVPYKYINILNSGTVNFVNGDPDSTTVSIFKNPNSITLTQTLNYDYLLADTIYTVQNSFIYPVTMPIPKFDPTITFSDVGFTSSAVSYWIFPTIENIRINGTTNKTERTASLVEAGFYDAVSWRSPGNGTAKFIFDFEFRFVNPSAIAKFGFGMGKNIEFFFPPSVIVNDKYKGNEEVENVPISTGYEYKFATFLKLYAFKSATIGLNSMTITIIPNYT